MEESGVICVVVVEIFGLREEGEIMVSTVKGLA